MPDHTSLFAIGQTNTYSRPQPHTIGCVGLLKSRGQICCFGNLRLLYCQCVTPLCHFRSDYIHYKTTSVLLFHILAYVRVCSGGSLSVCVLTAVCDVIFVVMSPADQCRRNTHMTDIIVQVWLTSSARTDLCFKAEVGSLRGSLAREQ